MKKTSDHTKISASSDEMFRELKRRGIFWSYSPEITYEQAGDGLLIEHLLKYGDFDEIVWAFDMYDRELIENVWRKTMVSDERYIKTNLLIARVFLGMDVESDYFKKAKNVRAEKLRMLAS